MVLLLLLLINGERIMHPNCERATVNSIKQAQMIDTCMAHKTKTHVISIQRHFKPRQLWTCHCCPKSEAIIMWWGSSIWIRAARLNGPIKCVLRWIWDNSYKNYATHTLPYSCGECNPGRNETFLETDIRKFRCSFEIHFEVFFLLSCWMVNYSNQKENINLTVQRYAQKPHTEIMNTLNVYNAARQQ